MLNKENGHSIGGYWYSPLGKGIAWKDKETKTREVRVRTLSGVIEEKGETTTLFCGINGERIPLAQITETVLENGVIVHQLTVKDEITQVKIPQIVWNKIGNWVSVRQDGDILCNEVKNACAEAGMDGNCTRAVGLLVYLLREGWGKM